jgi:hypothetical protein
MIQSGKKEGPTLKTIGPGRLFITYLPPNTCFCLLYFSEGVAQEYTM